MIFGILLLSVMLVSADTDHQTEIEEGRKLVDSKISSDKLNDKELEAIGDYYMEEMHPGKAHELMHEMMGGHDSELTKEMHINKFFFPGSMISINERKLIIKWNNKGKTQQEIAELLNCHQSSRAEKLDCCGIYPTLLSRTQSH